MSLFDKKVCIVFETRHDDYKGWINEWMKVLNYSLTFFVCIWRDLHSTEISISVAYSNTIYLVNIHQVPIKHIN